MQMNTGNSTQSALIKYKEGIGMFTEKMPEFTKRFNDFTEECFKEGLYRKNKNS